MMVHDRWIWGEWPDGSPCFLGNTLDEETTQEEKEALVADVFEEYDGVVRCHEWIETDGPVNVLVQTWERLREQEEARER